MEVEGELPVAQEAAESGDHHDERICVITNAFSVSPRGTDTTNNRMEEDENQARSRGFDTTRQEEMAREAEMTMQVETTMQAETSRQTEKSRQAETTRTVAALQHSTVIPVVVPSCIKKSTKGAGPTSEHLTLQLIENKHWKTREHVLIIIY